ncbi:AAC(3) family N-acetyltransferase [Microbispora tritici]|uniref:Aminoglycoside N(3)-acetyltransferase n=1 Tax=Microbispora tritici TaxID=2604471 RepID=A0ABY3LS09_9ACTN|nr:AAC(3) family N-acetyltransferase [Microbispora tritici]
MVGVRLSLSAFLAHLSLTTAGFLACRRPAPSGTGENGVLGRATLAEALRLLGLRRGQIVLVHASLRSVGEIAGGVATLYDALRDVLGRRGTLVVPAYTPGNSDTSKSFHRATRHMTPEEKEAYREQIPAFDPETTSSIECGVLSEYVRTRRRAVRSDHPQTSFAAVGPAARGITAGHRHDNHLGERSPLRELERRGAMVLLLGVSYDRCTAFHLAEYRYTPKPPTAVYGCAMKGDGRRTWISSEDVVLDDSDFGECGAAMELTEKVNLGRVGNADGRLFPLPAAVAFAQNWFAERRGRTGE